jgi:hypothetical protein
LFDAVLNHHEHVQREKPPNGKRLWFERPRGKVVVRSGCALQEAPEEEGGYVHEYRIPTFSGVLTDLGALRMRSPRSSATEQTRARLLDLWTGEEAFEHLR